MKLILAFFGILLQYLSASPTSKHVGRIIGGEDIPIEEVPYQISLQNNGSHDCGGSIVAPNYIVTAAHCTTGATAEILTVRAGSSVRESGGQVVNVKKIYKHPNYDSYTVDNDIAVLELAEDLVFGDAVATINLPSPDQSWPAGTDVLVTGWGVTDLLGSGLSEKLQGVTVELVDRDTCNEDYGGGITTHMLCAGVDEGGKDACSSDSGGPLQVDGFLLGVVSWGMGCADPDYPGVYADVTMFLDFIQEIIGQ